MAAVAKSVSAVTTVDQFKESLINSATDAGDSGYDTSYGNGIINFHAFLQELNIVAVESATLVVKAQTADGTSIQADSSATVKAEGTYAIAASTIENYTPVSFKIEGAVTEGVNKTFEVGSIEVTEILYSDIVSGLTSVTYIYEENHIVEEEAADIEFNFAGNYGGAAADAFNDIVLTSDAGFVAVGYTLGASESPVWEFKNTGTYAFNDGVIAKFNAADTLTFSACYNSIGTKLSRFYDMEEDAKGNLIVVGDHQTQQSS